MKNSEKQQRKLANDAVDRYKSRTKKSNELMKEAGELQVRLAQIESEATIKQTRVDSLRAQANTIETTPPLAAEISEEIAKLSAERNDVGSLRNQKRIDVDFFEGALNLCISYFSR
jgi:predicted secreted protein